MYQKQIAGSIMGKFLNAPTVSSDTYKYSRCGRFDPDIICSRLLMHPTRFDEIITTFQRIFNTKSFFQ